jgi:hypothetical protein
MRLVFRRLPLVLGTLLVAAAACQDATVAHPQSPLVGVWDVTTTFQTFTFETGAPSPPDCPGYTMYCTHSRTTTDGAYLAGVLEVRDTSTDGDPAHRTVVASGPFDVSFCDVVDFDGLTGCTHVSARAVIDYSGAISGVADTSMHQSLTLDVGEPGGDVFGLNRQLRSYDATFAGDSMYGSIYWGSGGGRSPPTYHGTFVAHRRK